MMRCFAACTAVRPKSPNGTSSSSTSPTWKSGSSYRASSSVTWVPGSSIASTTVLRTTIRIVPFSSSIEISARTFGPYRFTRAAWRPSFSSSIISPRSSCFELVSSRIAETTSVVLAIRCVLSFSQKAFGYRFQLPLNSESGLANGCERQGDGLAAFRSQHHRRFIWHGFDAGPYPAHPFEPRGDLAAHEAHPMAVPLQGPLHPGTRDLELVAGAERPTLIQPGLEHPAGPGAVL